MNNLLKVHYLLLYSFSVTQVLHHVRFQLFQDTIKKCRVVCLTMSIFRLLCHFRWHLCFLPLCLLPVSSASSDSPLSISLIPAISLLCCTWCHDGLNPLLLLTFLWSQTFLLLPVCTALFL